MAIWYCIQECILLINYYNVCKNEIEGLLSSYKIISTLLLNPHSVAGPSIERRFQDVPVSRSLVSSTQKRKNTISARPVSSEISLISPF